MSPSSPTSGAGGRRTSSRSNPSTAADRVTIDLTYRPTNLVGRLQLPLVRLVASRIQRPMLRQLVQLAHCRIETVRPLEEIAGMFADFD